MDFKFIQLKFNGIHKLVCIYLKRFDKVNRSKNGFEVVAMFLKV